MSELSPPISLLLKRFKSGEQEALAELVGEYWAGLVDFARSRLKDHPLRGSDEEDVVQSALVAFVGEVRAGRLEAIEHREELLAWLMTVVAHKAVDPSRATCSTCCGKCVRTIPPRRARSIVASLPTWRRSA